MRVVIPPDQIDEVRARLGAQWMVGDAPVSWMVYKLDNVGDVHAMVSSAMVALCGKAMVGAWQRRSYVAVKRRCPACAAYLRDHGRLV